MLNDILPRVKLWRRLRGGLWYYVYDAYGYYDWHRNYYAPFKYGHKSIICKEDYRKNKTKCLDNLEDRERKKRLLQAKNRFDALVTAREIEFFKKWHYPEAAQNEILKCHSCGWSGPRKDTIEKWVNTQRHLSGWKCMEYYCPSEQHQGQMIIGRIIMSRS